MDFTLRPTVIGGDRSDNDYTVFLEGRRIGRIRKAEERAGWGVVWEWAINPPLPIPTRGKGSELDLEQAKAAFRAAWKRFSATLTPEDIEHWHGLDDVLQRG